MTKDEIPEKLHKIAEECGYSLYYKRIRHRRGWPEPSTKPWGIYYSDGRLCAAFASLSALERNLRGRCGC